MFSVGKPGSKRRRHISSPAQDKSRQRHRGIKQHKIVKELDFKESSDISDSEYFSDIGDTQSSSVKQPIPPPITPSTSTMGNLSQADIDEIVTKLVPILAKEIKAQLMSEVKDLIKNETSKVLSELASVRNDNKALTDELNKTKRELDELEQYGRRMCLDVSGITGDTGHYSENVEDKILNHAKKCKIPLQSSDIDRCHRKGRPKPHVNRKVIVKFTNSKARQRFYQARKDLGAGIFAQKNLTPLREKLSYEARQLKRSGSLDNTWIAGCKV